MPPTAALPAAADIRSILSAAGANLLRAHPAQPPGGSERDDEPVAGGDLAAGNRLEKER